MTDETEDRAVPDALRVIPCPFVPTDPPIFGLTDGGIAASIPALRAFRDFILFDVRETRPDQLTLLHEISTPRRG